MGIALAGLAALAVAMGIGRFAFTPLLPMMQADAGLTLAQGGWLASANYAGYLVGALTAARAPLGIRGGLVAIAAATAAMALQGSFALWIVLRFIAGVASAWVLVQVSAWSLEHLAAAGRVRLSGVVFAGVGTGIAAAGLLCLGLMAARAGSGLAWVALGAASLAATALLWRLFNGTGAAAAPRRHEGWQPRWWWLVVAYGAYGFGYIIPATFLPAMARDLVADPAVFGWAWPVFGLAAMASTLAAVKIHDARRLWIAAHLVLAAGVVLPVAFSGLGGILVSALLVGGTFTVITLAAMRDARAVAGAQAARLMAALTAAFAAGQIVGPLFVSLLAQMHWSFERGLLIAGAGLALGALAFIPGRERP